MTALPFLYMVFGAEAGDPDGAICAIMVALYITQDSFGTACNVSGDNAHRCCDTKCDTFSCEC